MTVNKVLGIIDNPNAKVALYKFGGIQPNEAKHFVSISKAKEAFASYLDEKVLCVYNGSWYSSTDRTSADTYFTSPDLIVIEYK